VRLQSVILIKLLFFIFIFSILQVDPLSVHDVTQIAPSFWGSLKALPPLIHESRIGWLARWPAG
jgi:hypothetical protein